MLHRAHRAADGRTVFRTFETGTMHRSQSILGNRKLGGQPCFYCIFVRDLAPFQIVFDFLCMLLFFLKPGNTLAVPFRLRIVNLIFPLIDFLLDCQLRLIIIV